MNVFLLRCFESLQQCPHKQLKGKKRKEKVRASTRMQAIALFFRGMLIIAAKMKSKRSNQNFNNNSLWCFEERTKEFERK